MAKRLFVNRLTMHYGLERPEEMAQRILRSMEAAGHEIVCSQLEFGPARVDLYVTSRHEDPEGDATYTGGTPE